MNAPFDIKICGLTTPQTVEAAIEAGATMVGFVFVEGSPRYTSPDDAAALIEQAAGRAKTVGLVADADEDQLKSLMDALPLDHLQLHGRELRADLIKRFPDAIAAIGIGEPSDLPGDSVPAPFRWLFDARPPSASGPQGGHGSPFDWAVLQHYRGPTPFLLAGGLTPENVGDAIRANREIPGFAGVDVSSGVESARGVKDPRLIEAFVSAARAARAENFSA